MEYELVHEIQNLCPNTQMRDIFFDEVFTNDPAAHVQQLLKGRAEGISTQSGPAGQVTVYAQSDGLKHKFVFTPI